MATLSKLDSRCKKCKHKDSCNNKRMMACALAEMPKPDMKNAALPNVEPLAQPASRKHTPITIKIGKYGNINTSMEQITENINKQFTLKLNEGYL